MASLQTLPEELLEEILTYFVPSGESLWEIWHGYRHNPKPSKRDKSDDDGSDESAQELYNLCLVSKKLRNIAQPLLFSTFLDDGVIENLEETVRFANCLYRYPELGQFVQEITLSATIMLDPSESDDEYAFEISEHDIELYTTEIKNLGLGDEEDKWVSAMKMGDLAVFAALIVNKTPNLCRLSMPGKLSIMNPFPKLVHHNSSFLQKLDSY